MCGIAGIYFHDPSDLPMSVNAMEMLIDELLLGIQHRGTDATGVAAVTPSGDLHIEKADLEAERFIMWRKDLPETPRSVLLHTRFATQGTPMNLENNHPITYNNAVVVHNGHISNDNEIFRDEGLHRKAQVDSEAIAALFDRHGIEKANVALKKLDGNYAVAVADLRKPNSLVLAKGWSSPLFYFETPEGLVWASEEKVIINAINSVLKLDISYRHIERVDFGRLLLIEDGKVENLSFPTFTHTYKQNTLPKANDTNKGSEDETRTSSYFDNQAWRDWFSDRFRKDKKKEDKSNVVKADAKAYYDVDPLHVEFWRNEKHPIEYEIPTGSGIYLFKKCDGCDTAYQTTLLTIIEDDSILCSRCLEDYDMANTQEENPAVVHEVAVELVAERFNTNVDFVQWLLFESDDDELNDPNSNLVSLYLQFTEEFDTVYEQLTGNSLGAATTLARIATEKLESDDDEVAEIAEWENCGVEVFATEEDISWFRNDLTGVI